MEKIKINKNYDIIVELESKTELERFLDKVELLLETPHFDFENEKFKSDFPEQRQKLLDKRLMLENELREKVSILKQQQLEYRKENWVKTILTRQDDYYKLFDLYNGTKTFKEFRKQYLKDIFEIENIQEELFEQEELDELFSFEDEEDYNLDEK